MITATYVGNKKIDLEVSGFTVRTDLPQNLGGENSAPNPVDLFLSSLTACSATFAIFYLEKAKLGKEGVSLNLEPSFTPEGMIQSAKVTINIPKDFPKEHENGLKTAVERCKVGKHVTFPREVEIIRG